jgi:hypothetical protein
MTFDSWVEQYRIKLTRGKQGAEDLVLGKYGEIADADCVLHLRLLAVPRDRDMNKALNIRKRGAEAGGLKPVHVTEHVYESIWSFKPESAEHSALAIELVAPKRKRTVIMTDERKAALVATLAAARAARAQQAA